MVKIYLLVAIIETIEILTVGNEVKLTIIVNPGEKVYYTYAKAYVCNNLKKKQVISKSQ